MRKSIAIALKKKLLQMYLLFFYTLFSISTFGQEANLDTLLKSLKVQESDTSKVRILNDLAWEYRKIKPEKAIAFANEAKKLSDSLNYIEGSLTSLNRLAVVFLYRKETEKAKEIYLDILAQEQLRKNDYGIGRALNQLGIIFSREGDLKKSIDYTKRAEEKFEVLGKERIVAITSNNIASLYRKLGDYDNAMKYFLKNLKIVEKSGNKKRLAETYLNISVFYIDLKDYSKALEYLNECQFIYIKINDLYELSKVYKNLGVVFYRMQNYDESLKYYNLSLKLKKQLGLEEKDPGSYNNLGTLHHKKGNYELALDNYKKSLRIKKSSKVFNNIGHVYYLKGDFYKAIKHYKNALALASKTNQKFEKMNALNSLSNAYSGLKKYNLAVDYNYKYLTLRDSLESDYRKAIFIKSKSEEEKKKLELLEKDKKITEINFDKQRIESNRKSIIIYSLIFGLILVSLLFFAIYRGNKQKQSAQIAEKNRQIEQQKVEELLKNQELKSINAMMVGQEEERKRIARDLHDRLGSMLSMVKVHFKSVEDNLDKIKSSNKTLYKKANQLLDEACEEVRKISHDIDTGVLTQFGLVAALEDLTDLLKQSNQIDVEFIVYGFKERLDLNLEIAIYRIVQELVSNILKYAKSSEITIQMIKSEEMLNVMVEDDGIGFDISKSNNGMGLRNITSRVDSFNGDINIDSTINKGTTVSVDIPLNND